MSKSISQQTRKQLLQRIELLETRLAESERRLRAAGKRIIACRRGGAAGESRDQPETRVQDRPAKPRRRVDLIEADRRRLKTALDQLPAYLALLSPDHRVSYANRFFEERFGKSDGRRCYEYLFERAEPCEDCETYTVLKTNAPHRWEWTGPDGRTYDIYDFPFTDADGSPLVMEVGIDITERKQTDQALRDANEKLDQYVTERTAGLRAWLDRYRSVLELTGQLGWTTDPNGEVVEDMPVWRKFTGQTAEEIRGWGWSRALHPDDLKHTSEVWRAVVKRRSSYETEYRVRRHDGVYRDFLARGVPLLNDDGSIREWVGTCIDITDRKRVEEALRDSQRRMDRTQEIAHLGSWELDLVENRLYWSDEVYRIFGLQPQEFAATYEAFLEAVHPDDRAAVNESYMNSLHRNSESYEIEHRVIRRATGEVRIVYERCEHLRDASGRVIRSMGMVHDITDRKRVEEQLRETRDYLENLLDYANAPIIVWDPEFRITRFNHAFERLTGRTADDVLGKRLGILFPDETRDEAMSHIRRAVAGERWEVVEIRIARLDGTTRTVLWNSATIHGPDGRTVMATIAQGQDITKRKDAEEALRNGNLRTALLAETAAALLQSEEPQEVVKDLCEKVLTYLDCQVFFNYLVDQGNGRLHLNACAGISDDVARHIEWLDHGVAVCGCAARDGCRIVAERIPETPDPRTDLVRSMGIKAYACHPLLSQGRVFGTLSFGTTTRSSFTADDLAMMKAVTDQVVIAMERQRTMETLRRTAEDLARSNQDLEQFAYVASHDLQEPLRTVAGYLQLLDRRYKAKLDKDAEEFIGFAVDGALRLQQLINDLLSYSRVGTRSRPFERTDCNQVLEGVLEHLMGAIREGQATITHDPLPVVPADSVQLAQLFQNLIGNAIKFRRDELPRVHVSARRAGGQWEFSVRDNGIGMEPQYFDRVFVVFQRLHNRARYPGTGIGLAICKKIVDRHGGRIWIESEVGKGSTFHFTLSRGPT